MKILQISTYDLETGAGRAAYRLYKGLRQIGQDCQMLVRYKTSTDDSILGIAAKNLTEKFTEDFFLTMVIQGHYIDAYRTGLSNTIFSLSYPGYELSTSPIVQGTDIINLHWVARYQSPLTLHNLFSLKKPIVWTLHDQWPFTGGCHYTARCDKFKDDCINCPQLADDPFNLPAAILKDKLEYFKDANLTIVTPSRWLATCAKESKLFRNRRIEVIPNSLETDIFRPLPKAQAKAKWGLDADTTTILFGASDVKEKRKGFHALLEAIKYCLNDSRFRQFVASNRIKVLCFGYPDDSLVAAGIPVVALGYLGSDEEVRLAYTAADMFVLPSLEDNLPNTMLEAMSCGTIVVGFNVGGIPDVVKNGVNGYLVPLGDIQHLGKTILSLISETKQLSIMGQNCRQTIEEGYTLTIQAQRYLALYQDLYQQNKRSRKTIPKPILSSAQPNVPLQLTATVEQSVYLETAFGSNFQSISQQVLFKSLKEFAPYVQKKWQDSEADRAARLEVINNLSERLQASEIDREARLKIIEHQTREFEEKMATLEANSAARLEVIQELGIKLDASEANSAARLEVIQELGMKLDACEADRADRLEVIERQGRELEQVYDTLYAMKASKSWRITAPFRWLRSRWFNFSKNLRM